MRHRLTALCVLWCQQRTPHVCQLLRIVCCCRVHCDTGLMYASATFGCTQCNCTQHGCVRLAQDLTCQEVCLEQNSHVANVTVQLSCVPVPLLMCALSYVLAIVPGTPQRWRETQAEDPPSPWLR